MQGGLTPRWDQLGASPTPPPQSSRSPGPGHPSAPLCSSAPASPATPSGPPCASAPAPKYVSMSLPVASLPPGPCGPSSYPCCGHPPLHPPPTRPNNCAVPLSRDISPKNALDERQTAGPQGSPYLCMPKRLFWAPGSPCTGAPREPSPPQGSVPWGWEVPRGPAEADTQQSSSKHRTARALGTPRCKGTKPHALPWEPGPRQAGVRETWPLRAPSSAGTLEAQSSAA